MADSSHPIRVAPTQATLRVANAGDTEVTRQARLRVDIVAEDYPGGGKKPDFAYVQLLERPREGQPVLWASRGTNFLTLYTRSMLDGGVAFVVTGLAYIS